MLYDESRLLHLATGDQVPVVVREQSSPLTRPKCLLLHGNPGSLQVWARLMPLLEEVADVAALDLPGFGRSVRRDTTSEGVSLTALAQAALATLDALGWNEPCFVIGHSHGAAVAQTLAATHQQRVAGIVLLASLGAPAHLGYRLLALPGASSVARFSGWLLRSQDLRSMVQVVQGRPSEAILETAPRIQCPALFLHGQRDALVPVEFARTIHARIAGAGGNSRFEILPGAGHSLVRYQAAQIAERVRAFLR